MRRFGVILLALFHAALLAADPVGEEIGWESGWESEDLESYENERTENGYRFSYETKNGQTREEVGVIDAQTGVLRVTGRYSFRAPDGAIYRVNFVADENGYRPAEDMMQNLRPPSKVKPQGGLAGIGAVSFGGVSTEGIGGAVFDIPADPPKNEPVVVDLSRTALLTLTG